MLQSAPCLYNINYNIRTICFTYRLRSI
jgi:hypothetical protein